MQFNFLIFEYNKGIFDLKDYYLINKTWINKFKELFYYNEKFESIVKEFNLSKDDLKILLI